MVFIEGWPYLRGRFVHTRAHLGLSKGLFTEGDASITIENAASSLAANGRVPARKRIYSIGNIDRHYTHCKGYLLPES